MKSTPEIGNAGAASAHSYPISGVDFDETQKTNELKDPRWAALDDLTFEDE